MRLSLLNINLDSFKGIAQGRRTIWIDLCLVDMSGGDKTALFTIASEAYNTVHSRGWARDFHIDVLNIPLISINTDGGLILFGRRIR